MQVRLAGLERPLQDGVRLQLTFRLVECGRCRVWIAAELPRFAVDLRSGLDAATPLAAALQLELEDEVRTDVTRLGIGRHGHPKAAREAPTRVPQRNATLEHCSVNANTRPQA